MKQCLIITATIKPNSIMVSQHDEQLRRKEYLHTLQFYLNQYAGDIYFAENSGYNFESDEEFMALFAGERVRLIKCPSSTEFKKGKGYQEFEVLDSVTEQLTGKYDELIKVSGRYLVKNFQALVCQKNPGFVIDRHKKRKVAITSFFKCQLALYKKVLLNAYKEVDDSKGVFIEHIVYQRLEEVGDRRLALFTENPFYEGVSGSYGGDLNRHPKKMKLRNIERGVLKLLGIKKFIVEY